METEFEIVIECGISATLKCECGHVFDVDAHTNENLQWDKPKLAYIAVCPVCYRRQK
jgi:hypothetical protein